MKDRLVEFPNRYKLIPVSGQADTYDLQPVPGTITEEGTFLNKAVLFSDTNSERFGETDGTPNAGFSKITQEINITVPLLGWSENPDSTGWYTNQVQVSEMKSVYNPLLDLVITSATLADDERSAFSCIIECETFDGYVIFKAVDLPDIDFNVRFVGV